MGNLEQEDWNIYDSHSEPHPTCDWDYDYTSYQGKGYDHTKQDVHGDDEAEEAYGLTGGCCTIQEHSPSKAATPTYTDILKRNLEPAAALWEQRQRAAVRMTDRASTNRFECLASDTDEDGNYQDGIDDMLPPDSYSRPKTLHSNNAITPKHCFLMSELGAELARQAKQ